jgi:hypothetical protein
MRAKRINSDIAHIIFFLRFGGVRFHLAFPHLSSEHREIPGSSECHSGPLNGGNSRARSNGNDH